MRRTRNPCAEQQIVIHKKVIRKSSDASMDYNLPASQIKKLFDAGEVSFIPDCMGYMFKKDPHIKRKPIY